MMLANWLNVAGLLACLFGAFGLRALQTPRGAVMAWTLPRFGGAARFCDRWRGDLLRHSWDAVVLGFLLQIAAQFL